MCMALSHECCYLLNSGASQSFSDILNLSLEDVLDQHRVLKWNVCSRSVKSSTVNVKRLRLFLFKTQNGSSKTEPNQLGAWKKGPINDTQHVRSHCKSALQGVRNSRVWHEELIPKLSTADCRARPGTWGPRGSRDTVTLILLTFLRLYGHSILNSSSKSASGCIRLWQHDEKKKRFAILKHTAEA